MNVAVEKPLYKNQVCKMLRLFNDRKVRQETLEVLMELRQVPLKEAQNIKVLKPSEVAAVLERFA